MSRFRIRSLVVAIVAAVAAAFVSPQVAAAAAKELVVIATSAKNGPVALAAGPVSVALAPPAGAAASVGERLAAVDPGRTLYLVLTGLRASTQPETLYQVYLGLPSGAAPTPDSASYVGTFNFFNAAIGDEANGGGDSSRFFSYDVTDLVRSLQARKLLGETVSVTLVPAGQPNAATRPVVGEVALVLD
jgi:tyrosinase